MAVPPAPGASQPNPQLQERLFQMVDGWKRRLLDLTRRNKALNFKPTRVSTIAVVDEQPAEIFRHLYLRELAMKFRAQPEKPKGASAGESSPAAQTQPGQPAQASAASDTSAAVSAPAPLAPETKSSPAPATKTTPPSPPSPQSPPSPLPPPPAPLPLADDELDVDEIEGAGQDFVPYDAAALGERHRDDWLQTASTPEALDKSLRRIDEVSRTTIEEQGVNTLYLTLGMLYYKESPEADEVFKAPLVMLPVALARKSARSGYVLTAADEDPLANPALAELMRRNYGISLPELPASDSYKEDYDLQNYFADISQRIAAQSTWAVKNDVFLASFSFQKLVMYKDLETHQAPAAQHRLVRQLATREGSEIIGLPEPIRSMDLDAQFPPEATHQVVDADASQLRAIAAVARAHDLVIEGPPGTGKSQTITNLIATSLAAGKSVLFVAEKQAALSVVHNRLVAAGLGEFCLELHSNKASKRAVLQQVGEALDASLQSLAYPAAAMERLPQIRAELTAYARAVHAPFGALGWSPYRVYGEFSRLLEAPRKAFTGAVETVSAAQLDETCRLLDSLAAAAQPIGRPAEHPWRDADKGAYLPTDREEIDDAAAQVSRLLEALLARAAKIATELGFAQLETWADLAHATQTAQLLARSPGAPRQVLESEAWNQAPADALALIKDGRDLATLRAKVAALFTDAALEREHADDCAFMVAKLSGNFSFLAFLNGRYRATKRRWLGYRVPANKRELLDLAEDLKLVDKLRRDRAALEAKQATGQALFGAWWQGETSDWAALDRYIEWVTEFRQTCLRFHLQSGAAAALATQRTPDVAHVLQLDTAAKETHAAVATLCTQVGWPAGYFEITPLREVAARIATLRAHLAQGPAWAGYENARKAAAATLAADYVHAAVQGELAFADASRSFRRGFFARWLSACLKERPVLERFQTLSHEERLAEFRRLDERVLQDNRARLVGQLRDAVQHKLKQPEVTAAMPVLRRELARQRGHQPLRRTLREAETAVRAIKPCFMMSPLTVAQFLDGQAPTFDVVIFDEASQLPSEDAAGAIIRGRQLVVVGDPKQLPPTAFFASGQPAVSDDGSPLGPDPESVLEEYMGAGMPMSRLKWHYRSAHESLINFSNVSFYDAQLYTFPSVESGGGASRGGLQFEHVAAGVYEGKGLNPLEAKRVADAVVEFAKLQAQRRAAGEPTQSLGVGTFNLRQQLAIQDELEERRRADPSLEPFFDRSGHEPFFVKNLENIQGDERDVIFISVTYAKGADGKLRYNFGPLNGENGWRRLNVLVTRARHRMCVFSSMRGDEINPAATTSGGAQLLRDFLIYAERGRLDGGVESRGEAVESLFEREVAAGLAQRGFKIVPQVGVAGYRIDLGVLDDELPGRFLCGIECDGAAYHASETARDRDRLRQQVLEARGWTIHRVWSTSWFLDRKAQLDRLCQLITETRQRLLQERDAEQAARDRTAAEATRKQAEDAARAAQEAEEARKLATVPYQRMQAEPYVVTPVDPTLNRGSLLDAPLSQLSADVITVVEFEGPIHLDDLCTRVAQLWSVKALAKACRRIESAADAAEGQILRRGDFFWRPDLQCRLRSRAEVRTPADRIAPEEYQGILRRILSAGHGFSREQLVTEVRTILGYSRTGAALDEAIRAAIDALLRANEAGEGSTGIKLRARAK